MKITNYFIEAELHGAQMDEVTHVGIILNSLSSDFIQFTSNYIMNKLTYGLSQLLNELQTFESITRHGKNKGSALYADKSSSPKTKKMLTSGAESSKARPNTSKGKGPAKKERKNFKRSGKGKEKKVNVTTATLKAIGRGIVLCTWLSLRKQEECWYGTLNFMIKDILKIF